MVLLNLVHRQRDRANDILLRKIRWFFIFSIFFVLFWLIGNTAYIHNYIFSELLFLSEKALLVFHGKPPRLENLGFVYPPLPYMFVLIFRNPFVASAVAGAVTGCVFVFIVGRALILKDIPFSLFVSFIVFFMFSPPMVFVLSEDLNFCLFLVSLVLLYDQLYSYCKDGFTINLLLFGMISAAMFLIKFQAVFIIPLLIFPFLVYKENRGLRKISILTIAFFPSMFFAFSWCYLNWVFMKDPFYFITFWLNSMGENNPLKESGFIPYLTHKVTALWPFILPYFVEILRQFKVGYTRCRISPFVLSIPFVLMASDFYIGVHSIHSIHYFLIFVFTALITRVKVVPKDLDTGLLDKLFVFTFLISLVFSFIFCLKINPNSEEGVFLTALKAPLESSSLKDARDLIEHIGSEGKILADDTKVFPVVFELGEPKRFVLPYQYEYETVLSSPHLFAKYVITYSSTSTGSTMDRVSGRYPEASIGHLGHFQLEGRFGNFLLYKASP